MAMLSRRPSVVDFIDMVAVAPDLRIDEIRVMEGSPLAGRSAGQIAEAAPGVVVVAVRGEGGS